MDVLNNNLFEFSKADMIDGPKPEVIQNEIKSNETSSLNESVLNDYQQVSDDDDDFGTSFYKSKQRKKSKNNLISDDEDEEEDVQSNSKAEKINSNTIEINPIEKHNNDEDSTVQKKIVDDIENEERHNSSDEDSSSGDEEIRIFRSDNPTDKTSSEPVPKPIPNRKKVNNSSKAELFGLKSETQRILRESNVELPYHLPEQMSIREYMQKKEETKKISSTKKVNNSQNVVAKLPLKKVSDQSINPTKKKNGSKKARIISFLASQGKTLPKLVVHSQSQNSQPISLKVDSDSFDKKKSVESRKMTKVQHKKYLQELMKKQREERRREKEELSKIDNEEFDDEEEEIIDDSDEEIYSNHSDKAEDIEENETPILESSDSESLMKNDKHTKDSQNYLFDNLDDEMSRGSLNKSESSKNAFCIDEVSRSSEKNSSIPLRQSSPSTESHFSPKSSTSDQEMVFFHDFLNNNKSSESFSDSQQNLQSSKIEKSSQKDNVLAEVCDIDENANDGSTLEKVLKLCSSQFLEKSFDGQDSNAATDKNKTDLISLMSPISNKFISKTNKGQDEKIIYCDKEISMIKRKRSANTDKEVYSGVRNLIENNNDTFDNKDDSSIDFGDHQKKADGLEIKEKSKKREHRDFDDSNSKSNIEDSMDDGVKNGNIFSDESDDDEEEMLIIRKKKKVEVEDVKLHVQNLIEDQAELSGEDIDEEDDDAEDQDYYEEDVIDEVLPEEEEIQKQVNKAHLKQLLDEDQRKVDLLKEVYIDDDPFLNRKRRFRWNNIDDSEFKNTLLADAEDDDENDKLDGPDFMNEESQWRTMRFERAEFLENTADRDDFISSQSQIMKLGKELLDDSRSRSHFNEEMKNGLKNNSNSCSKSRDSFLNRGANVLAKYAQFKDIKTMKGAVNSEKMIFKPKMVAKKRLLSNSAPLSSQRLISSSKKAKSVFDYFKHN